MAVHDHISNKHFYISNSVHAIYSSEFFLNGSPALNNMAYKNKVLCDKR